MSTKSIVRQTVTKLTSEHIELIRHLVSIGTTGEEIANQLNISIRCIRYNIKKYNIYSRPRDRINKVRQLTTEGFTTTEIARKLGVCPAAVHAIKRKHGIIGFKKTKDKKIISQLIYEGKTNQQIADYLEISTTTVFRVKRELNITTNTRSEIRKKLGIISTIPSNIVNEVRRLCSDGKSVSHIVNELGIRRPQIDYIRRKYNMPFRKPIVNEEVIELIKRRTMEGILAKDIAKEVGITVEYLHNIRFKHNIKPPQKNNS